MDLSYYRDNEHPRSLGTGDCQHAIAVRRQAITPMGVMHLAQCLAALSVTTVHRPRRARYVDPALLQNRSNVADRQKTVGVSRGGAPY